MRVTTLIFHGLFQFLVQNIANNFLGDVVRRKRYKIDFYFVLMIKSMFVKEKFCRDVVW